jgi:phosphate transport system permease protein
MSATLEDPPTTGAVSDALLNRKRFRFLGLTPDEMIRYFFQGNAAVAILVLVLIMVFLLREGAGFFGQNLRDLRVYRLAGLELVDVLKRQVDAHTEMSRAVSELRLRQFDEHLKQGKTVEEANSALDSFDAFGTAFGDAVEEVRGLASDLAELAAATKQKEQIYRDTLEQKSMLLRAGRPQEAEAIVATPVNFTAEVEPIQAALPAYREANRHFAEKIETALTADVSPSLEATMVTELAALKAKARAFVDTFPAIEKRLSEWRNDAPIPWYESLTSFLFGREWLTASFWQDWYGIVPLFVGSLLVSAIALLIAIPLSIAGAVYVSEIARSRERHVIKPAIEFISAIPSVVLGFFGVAVLGETLRLISQTPWLSWFPGFPMSERLNSLTAGCLLALMAIPTIFSLAEDALNNVPGHLKEASFALGATRFQTVVRILIPASISGIISAILLGFGRVIGETMVVLLCAGNRIAIPDFTQGLGAFFQPVHTMTGIIAQEMGEVVPGSIHYRALFMVGIVLFVLALGINYLAQRIVHRYRISIG